MFKAPLEVKRRRKYKSRTCVFAFYDDDGAIYKRLYYPKPTKADFRRKKWKQINCWNFALRAKAMKYCESMGESEFPE